MCVCVFGHVSQSRLSRRRGRQLLLASLISSAAHEGCSNFKNVASAAQDSDDKVKRRVGGGNVGKDDER
jgi:hypothetical protein